MLERAVMHAWWTHSCNVVLTEWECCMCHLCPIFHSWAFVCLRDLLRVRECVFVCVREKVGKPHCKCDSVFLNAFLWCTYIYGHMEPNYTRIYINVYMCTLLSMCTVRLYWMCMCGLYFIMFVHARIHVHKY